MLFDATQQVSPVTQDYLKAIWQSTEWGGRPATTSSLAARFGTSQANVSDVLSRLTKAQLVVREPYRPCALTPRGVALALGIKASDAPCIRWRRGTAPATTRPPT